MPTGLVKNPEALGVIRNSMWGVADNAVLSASNFLMMVLLARVLEPHGFGQFTLAFTVLLFTNSLQEALISLPLSVHGSVRDGTQYGHYTAATACSQFALALASACVVAGAGLIFRAVGWHFSSLLFALAPAVALWQLHEFVRRVLYTRSLLFQAFLNDATSHATLATALVLLSYKGYLTSTTALLSLASSSLLGFLLGGWMVHSLLDWSLSRQHIKEAVKANWTFGKWLLGGQLAFWTSSQVYPILAAAFISVSANGMMRAAQTILGPNNIIISAVDGILGPRAAKVYANGGGTELRPFIRKTQMLVALIAGGYCLLVASLARPILQTVFGEEYAHYAWLLVVMAIANAATSLRIPLAVGLRAMGKTSPIFRAYLSSSAASLTLGIALIWKFGLPGAAVGMLMNAAIMQFTIWGPYLRHVSHEGPVAAAATIESPRPGLANLSNQ
jgi:O-antigen/teichoic acid export membrane protein